MTGNGNINVADLAEVTRGMGIRVAYYDSTQSQSIDRAVGEDVRTSDGFSDAVRSEPIDRASLERVKRF